MRQEKLIAIAFVVAALIFSAVTYSFAYKVVVVKNGVPVEVETVKSKAYRVTPYRAVMVRPMMPRCRTVYVIPMRRGYMMRCPYGGLAKGKGYYGKRYRRGYRRGYCLMKQAPRRIDMVPNLQNTSYGFKYHNIHPVPVPYAQ